MQKIDRLHVPLQKDMLERRALLKRIATVDLNIRMVRDRLRSDASFERVHVDRLLRHDDHHMRQAAAAERALLD